MRQEFRPRGPPDITPRIIFPRPPGREAGFWSWRKRGVRFPPVVKVAGVGTGVVELSRTITEPPDRIDRASACRGKSTVPFQQFRPAVVAASTMSFLLLGTAGVHAEETADRKSV